ncbi:MCE family protein [Mycobacteroides salmoniphilum]|uniref:MCE family protein n=1 Tax=Mycobacteroides salmoniphilum TaxID=404941 RepID=UPI0010660D1A|nr:MCE family protein [Mycobacteroides salmoniphilum]TDZ99337.1 mce related protein [Mycobacteroides salmoniphilum]
MNYKIVRAALLVLITTGVAMVVFAVMPRAADHPMTVTAQFEDSVGLYLGNDVSVLGMPIGRVTGIAAKNSYVEVTLEIDKGVKIPAAAQAVTVSTSILTDRHIELTPAYRDGPTLRNGDVLGLARTRTPVEFDRTLAMVDKLSRALSGDNQGHGPMADLIGIGAQITSGNGPNIKATLDQLSEALRLSADSGNRSKKDIQAIVANLAELTQASADNDTAIRQFGSNVRRLSDILADEDLGTGSTGAKINQILDQAASLLNKNRDRLKGTVANAQTITTAINDNRRELAEFFDVAPLAIDNLYNAIDTNAGSFRVHGLVDKTLFNGQLAKEVCNLIGDKQLGCATGTIRDYGPDFGLTGMLELMAGDHR